MENILLKMKKIKMKRIGGSIEMNVLEICPVCKEVIAYKDGIYEVTTDCKCMKNYRISMKMKKINSLSLVNNQDKFENSNFRNEDEEILINKCIKYSEEYKPGAKGIMFLGNTGNGKTFLSNCITNSIKEKGFMTIGINLSSYLRLIREEPQKENEYLRIVNDVDLFFIDDVGSEKLSDWGKEKVYNLVDEIYRKEKTLLITSNLKKNDMEEHFDMSGSNKIVDRISGLCSVAVLKSESRRVSENF